MMDLDAVTERIGSMIEDDPREAEATALALVEEARRMRRAIAIMRGALAWVVTSPVNVVAQNHAQKALRDAYEALGYAP